ncbi:hypothetical protein F0562_017373 [Nyssa sinensis]|uniref:Disease resistance N-terminal domain-containing protein n=1 Tax=Nyssa sinensis TaxID=561372 RepID=A0A5J4ZF07_9ASTE|nr:hypothetical protein F0562_017373 [Nyssa sinensis]
MAESFVNNVFDKLSSFALEEVYLAWHVRNELQKLSETSTSIEEFLWSNADQQQQQAKSRQDEWHEKMEDIFYDADDVLDEFQVHAKTVYNHKKIGEHFKLKMLRYLTSLEKLVISNCEKLDLMIADEGEMDVLRSLQFFAIEQVPKLVALPLWLQGASETLNHIVIEDCLNFTTLPEWMKNLILLQKLEVSGCQRLTSLPEFTFSLREIRISQCPELIRECQRETGKDWQKITCVPDIYLDNIKI